MSCRVVLSQSVTGTETAVFFFFFSFIMIVFSDHRAESHPPPPYASIIPETDTSDSIFNLPGLGLEVDVVFIYFVKGKITITMACEELRR